MKKIITIGIPCYNEEKNIKNTYEKINKIIKKIHNYNFHFLFVDNGSTDATKKEILLLTKKHKNIQGIFLSRDFGPEASASALMDYAQGDAIIALPCDLQDPPQLIPEFIKKWEDGYNMVVGVYTNTEDDFFTSFLRKAFYSIFKKISNIDVPVFASGVGLLDRKSLEALKILPEKYRFFRGLRAWIGFKVAYVKYKRVKRQRGKSSYNLISYFKHAERGIFGFSYLLLDLMAYAGFILVAFSFLFLIGYIMISLIYGNPIKGSITILFFIVFFGGVQLLAVSIIGKYIQVIMEETKNRPVYIIDETINLKS
ncbi:MAG: glycosyltransferase family 2 protein [Patescibacteria group bacterium]